MLFNESMNLDFEKDNSAKRTNRKANLIKKKMEMMCNIAKYYSSDPFVGMRTLKSVKCNLQIAFLESLILKLKSMKWKQHNASRISQSAKQKTSCTIWKLQCTDQKEQSNS